MMRNGLRLLGVLALMVGAPDLAEACSCKYSGPPCQAFWTAEAVFDATVIGMQRFPREQRGDRTPVFRDDTLVTLDVHAAYKGANTGSLQVTTYSDEAGCGYPFKVASRYLVFARRAPTGELTVSLCSATRIFDGTGPTAAFLASLSQPPRGGRLFGTVHTSSGALSSPGQTPLETEVRLSGPDGVKTTRSVGGQYEFGGLNVGRYDVEAVAPGGYGGAQFPDAVEIVDSRGCAEWNVTFTPAGRISGLAVNREGQPLSKISIELIAADAKPTKYGLSPRSTWSGSDGAFVFDGLGPGRYIVGVNLDDLPNEYRPHPRTTYPGAGLEPQVIELTLGQAVELGTFTIPPPVPVVRVTGTVVRQDGSPVAGVYVSARDATGNPDSFMRGAGGTTTDPSGRFELSLREGRIYTFDARGLNNQPLRISAPRLPTDSAPAPIQIVILPDR